MSRCREKEFDVIVILAAVQSSRAVVNDDNHEAKGFAGVVFFRHSRQRRACQLAAGYQANTTQG
jgi:hypothetical protein